MGILEPGTGVRHLGDGVVVRGDCTAESNTRHFWFVCFHVWVLDIGKHFSECETGLACTQDSISIESSVRIMSYHRYSAT